MTPFTCETGVAAPFPAANVDTDVIMPKQFLKGIDRAGLAEGVFHGLRLDAAGAPDPAFILNRPPWNQARFLVVGPNFGCGSSREHAVWGLMQRGIRAVIGTSFAGIFFDNCARNGMLALILDAAGHRTLLEGCSDPAKATLTVDLEGQEIRPATGPAIRFEIEPERREVLLRGLDAIGATLAESALLHAFETSYREAHPWLP